MTFSTFFLTLAMLLGQTPAEDGVMVIADFSPENVALWQDTGAGGKMPVTAAEGGPGVASAGVVNADFKQFPAYSRTSHDLPVKLDLAGLSRFELAVSVENAAVFSGSTLYFHSGDGWYGISGGVPDGDSVLTFQRADARPEGTPGGWENVDRVRIAFWKMKNDAAKITFRELRAVKEPVLFLAFKNPDGVTPWVAKNNAKILEEIFARAGVSADFLEVNTAGDAVMTDAHWAAALRKREAVFVVHERNLTPTSRELLEAWAAENEKTCEFFDGDFRETGIAEDEKGLNRLYSLLRARFPRLVKRKCLELLTTVGGEPVFADEALRIRTARLNALWENTPPRETLPLIKTCEKEHLRLLRLAAAEVWRTDTDNTLKFRGWWNHSGLGAYPGDWPRSAKELKAAGFTDVFPNLLWAGEAHYPSEFIPSGKTFAEHGDQLKACVEACHAHGIRVHVWKVNFRLESHVTPEFLQKMRDENRLQKSVTGEEKRWLCPSHPANFELEWRSMLEIAQKYPVDGVHFDYIRYDGGQYCFCDGCRERFMAESGMAVENWPADVRVDAPQSRERDAFQQWRRERITRLVAKVHAEVKKLRPEVQVSAAVFSGYPACKTSIGQDWAAWAEAGIVDFLCPMNYTQQAASFQNMTRTQREYVPAGFPLYPGIGVWRLTPDGVVEQMRAAAALECPGVMCFDLSPRAAETVLPVFTPDEKEGE